MTATFTFEETDSPCYGKQMHPQEEATELSPLIFDRQQGPSSDPIYRTFPTSTNKEIVPTTNKPFWDVITHGLGLPHFRSNLGHFKPWYQRIGSYQKEPVGNSRRKAISILVCGLFAAMTMFSSQMGSRDNSSSDGFIIDYAEPSLAGSDTTRKTEPELFWDHNVYYAPRSAATSTRRYHSVVLTNTGSHDMELASTPVGRNLLIAQVVGGSYRSSTQSALLGADSSPRQLLAQFADITSRPNRAYARQWGRNYVRFRSRPNEGLGLASFLKDTLERQQDVHQQLERSFLPYDAVALIPPGAILMDLDYDLLELIPADKLLSITGWEGYSPNDDGAEVRNEVIFFNLRHRLADQVIRRWWDELESAHQQLNAANDVGNGDATSLLIRIIESVVDEGENLFSVLFQLEEADGGFVLEAPYSDTGNATSHHTMASVPYCIKRFSKATAETSSLLASSSPLPTSVLLLSDPEVTRATLQTTADAVCYRYYPKCEIM